MSLKTGDLKFDGRGLVPAIVQDAHTREVLTLAYMNEESLRRTLEESETWFWSRSRAELWHKGATSGNTQRVLEVRPDCDSDALLLLVEPRGPACHTGAHTCFHQHLEDYPLRNREASDKVSGDGEDFKLREDVEGGANEEDLGRVLARLFNVVESRRLELPENSYTTYLFEQGLNKILKKVGEESAEIIIAAKDGDSGALTSELSDLVYHLVVLMVERGLKPVDLARELARRGAEKGEA